jgi:hypothetical protein
MAQRFYYQEFTLNRKGNGNESEKPKENPIVKPGDLEGIVTILISCGFQVVVSENRINGLPENFLVGGKEPIDKSSNKYETAFNELIAPLKWSYTRGKLLYGFGQQTAKTK